MSRHVRLAEPNDSLQIAQLLHDFNTEFETPVPTVEFITHRLTELLPTGEMFVIAAGDPIEGFGVVSLRSNICYSGRVATLDELYVVPQQRNKGLGTRIINYLLEVSSQKDIDVIEINVDEPDTDAQRFYERHGFCGVEQPNGYRAFYYYRELRD